MRPHATGTRTREFFLEEAEGGVYNLGSRFEVHKYLLATSASYLTGLERTWALTLYASGQTVCGLQVAHADQTFNWFRPLFSPFGKWVNSTFWKRRAYCGSWQSPAASLPGIDVAAFSRSRSHLSTASRCHLTERPKRTLGTAEVPAPPPSHVFREIPVSASNSTALKNSRSGQYFLSCLCTLPNL